MIRALSNSTQRNNRSYKRRKSGRMRMGAAMVEFAVVSPLMILFTLGMLEIGRMTMVKQLLVNVSREGAREGTLPNSTNTSVKNSVDALLEKSDITGATVTVASTSIPSSSGVYITVSITVPSQNVSWLSTPIFMSGKSVSASTSMRKESL